MPPLVKTRRRLKTVKSLNSIFNALQVITLARLQKIKAKHAAAKQYLLELKTMAEEVGQAEGLSGPAEGMAVLFSGNRGFCGMFNQNILFRTRSFIEEGEATFLVFGRKGLEFLRSRRQKVADSYLAEDYGFSFFEEKAAGILKRFRAGEIGGVDLIFNHFRSVMRQDAVANRILPEAGPPDGRPVLVEPSRETAADKIKLRRLAMELYFAYLDSQLGEVSARLFTLKGAIENSKELINDLSIALNKARQQSITNELLEIIASSESLKEAA
ncbi:MAG: FoF1 ATP synthase subunit gamma [Candidatus Margulisiibacteriota bacterium]